MTSALESITFPIRPYGQMPRQFLSLVEGPNQGFPDAWPVNADRDAFLADAYKLLDISVGDTHPWVLLSRELEHLIAMSADLSKPVLKSKGAALKTHKDLLREEDNAALGSDLVLYCPTLASRLPGKLFEDLTEMAFTAHLGSVTLLLKQRFQRIRPYQAYQVLVDAGQRPAGAGFSLELLQTPWSPAYPGGHCYQAALAFAFAVTQLQDMPVALSTQEYGSLAQYAADIGDRRIMAGLHYPLDSVGSWLLARAVAEQTMQDPIRARACNFMAACVKRSRAYRAIQSETIAPYPEVLRQLHAGFPEIGTPLNEKGARTSLQRASGALRSAKEPRGGSGKKRK